MHLGAAEIIKERAAERPTIEFWIQGEVTKKTGSNGTEKHPLPNVGFLLKKQKEGRGEMELNRSIVESSNRLGLVGMKLSVGRTGTKTSEYVSNVGIILGSQKKGGGG